MYLQGCRILPGANQLLRVMLPALSKAGAAGLVVQESPEPSQSRAGPAPCSSGMGRDVHRADVGTGAPAGKPILPVHGPLS